ETRFGGGDVGRIRAHAAELVALAPDVIVANTTPVTRAVRQATSSIPIVMAGVNDPVDQGFVSRLAHPGGNITGFSFIDFQMVGKWLEMLKEAAPGVSPAALMFTPDTAPQYYLYLRSFETVPRSIAVEVTAAPVRDTAEIEAAIAKLGRELGGGLIVAPDGFTTVHVDDLTKSAAAGKPELFDLAAAHELYGVLFGPVEALIKDKRHVFMVPSGPLTALPFHLLGHREAIRCGTADQGYRRIPRCRLAGEAACGHGAPVSYEPEGFAGIRR